MKRNAAPAKRSNNETPPPCLGNGITDGEGAESGGGERQECGHRAYRLIHQRGDLLRRVAACTELERKKLCGQERALVRF